MKCLFCDFTGEKDELIAHSAECTGHPLYGEMVAAKLAHQKDDPEMDASDFAHPAWWRGEDYTFKLVSFHINKILDGDPVGGVSNEPWQSLRLRLAKLRDENRELNALFELQGKRLSEATHRWRAAHPGKEHVIPDLGELLHWMLGTMDSLLVSLDFLSCAGRAVVDRWDSNDWKTLGHTGITINQLRTALESVKREPSKPTEPRSSATKSPTLMDALRRGTTEDETT